MNPSAPLILGSILSSLVLAAGGDEGTIVPARDYPEIRRRLESFDAAWSERRVEDLVEPFADRVWSPLYGRVPVERIARAFRILLDRLPDTSCRTRVLRIQDDGRRVQAFLCRTFRRSQVEATAETRGEGAAPLEEQCHAVYLTRRDGDWKIDAFEDYVHRDLDDLGERVYRPRRLPLSVRIPSGAFAVPAPSCGSVLHQLVLRSDDLRVEVRLLVVQTRESLDLRQAFDTDLERVLRRRDGRVVEPSRPGSVAGRPSLRAEIACTDAGGDEALRSVRVYAALGEHYLLAVTSSAPTALASRARDLLDALLAGVSVDLPADASFDEEVDRRNGWGPLAQPCFDCAETGLHLVAPKGIALRLESTGTCTSLLAESRDGSIRIHVDCVRLDDPERPLARYARVDDVARAAERLSTRSFRLRDLDALDVLRRLPGRPERRERVVYVAGSGSLVTLRAVGRPEDIDRAAPLFDALLAQLRLDAKKR